MIKQIEGIMESNATVSLLTACEEGDEEIVHRLLEGGADPNSRNDKFTALGLASMYNHYNIVDDLINHNADVNLQDKYLRTALYYACKLQDKYVTFRLLDAGADVDVVDKEGYYPIQMAVINNNMEILKRLLSLFNINMKDRFGVTLLYLACESNHEPIVDLLLRSDADPNIPSNSGETSLHKALDNGNNNIVQKLLQAISNPNIPNINGEYPLHQCVRLDNPIIVTDLLKAGANPFVRDCDDCTPRDLAIDLYNRIDRYNMLNDAEQNWQVIKESGID